MMYSCMYNHQTPLPPLSLQRESYNQQTVVAWPKGHIFTRKKQKKTKVTQSEMFSRLVDRVLSFSTWSPLLESACLQAVLAFC